VLEKGQVRREKKERGGGGLWPAGIWGRATEKRLCPSPGKKDSRQGGGGGGDWWGGGGGKKREQRKGGGVRGYYVEGGGKFGGVRGMGERRGEGGGEDDG